MLKLLSLLILCAIVYAQSLERVSTVDAWGSTDSLLLVLADSAPPEVSIDRSIRIDNALGGERDIEITAKAGEPDTVSFIHTSDDAISFAAPSRMSGELLIQYDGLDDNISLDDNGLGQIDLTANGGDRFKFSMECDVGATVILTVYSASGVGSYEFEVGALVGFEDFFARFSDFDGNVDFTRVGAMEIMIPFDNNLDITIADFFIMRPITVEEIYSPESFSPVSYSPESFSPVSFSPESFSPESFSPVSYSPESFSPVSFSPESPVSVSPVSETPLSFSPISYSPVSVSPVTFSTISYSPESPETVTFSPVTFSPVTFSPDTISVPTETISFSTESESPVSFSPISISPVSEETPPPPGVCREFVRPIGEVFIDYNLGCRRHAWESSSSGASTIAWSIAVSCLTFLFLF